MDKTQPTHTSLFVQLRKSIKQLKVLLEEITGLIVIAAGLVFLIQSIMKIVQAH